MSYIGEHRAARDQQAKLEAELRQTTDPAARARIEALIDDLESDARCSWSMAREECREDDDRWDDYDDEDC
jgi:hypothetical protein